LGKVTVYNNFEGEIVTASAFDVLREEEGQGLVEYSLILVLVALVVVAGLTGYGVELRNIFQRIVIALPF
jgi:pilus assembly protein Flp/PilA